MKKRYNISLDDSLHQWGKQQAAREGTDFSGYLTRLISDARGAVSEQKIRAEDLEALRRLLDKQRKGRGR